MKEAGLFLYERTSHLLLPPGGDAGRYIFVYTLPRTPSWPPTPKSHAYESPRPSSSSREKKGRRKKKDKTHVGKVLKTPRSWREEQPKRSLYHLPLAPGMMEQYTSPKIKEHPQPIEGFRVSGSVGSGGRMGLHKSGIRAGFLRRPTDYYESNGKGIVGV